MTRFPGGVGLPLERGSECRGFRSYCSKHVARALGKRTSERFAEQAFAEKPLGRPQVEPSL